MTRLLAYILEVPLPTNSLFVNLKLNCCQPALLVFCQAASECKPGSFLTLLKSTINTGVAQTKCTVTAGEPGIGARHVQQCMWSGRNKPDAGVPVHAPHYQMLLTSKVQKWQDDNNFNPYLTTSQVLAPEVYVTMTYNAEKSFGCSSLIAVAMRWAGLAI